MNLLYWAGVIVISLRSFVLKRAYLRSKMRHDVQYESISKIVCAYGYTAFVHPM